MGRMVIAAYRPHKGKDAELLKLAKEHLPILRSQNLVTDRPAYAMKAADGTIIEVFEWKSDDAIKAAHENPLILEMWKQYEQVCDYVSLSKVKESSDLFAGFEPIEL